MNALEIRSLQKHRKGFSLDGINLTLPAGCIMGLIGENGAGKTTTIKLMLDMIRKDGGTAGGFDEKLSAARACGAEAIVIRRPKDVGESMEEILRFVRKRL